MDLETVEKELCVGRGTSIFLTQQFTTLDEMRKFINPNFNNLTPPSLLPNINDFTDLALLAIDNGEGLFVWGHDDVDGHTSTAVMVKTLKLLNARVGYHIPDKKKEGYIIPPEWLTRIKEEGFTTLITVDFGSSSPLNLKNCQEAGIQLLVTDHHEVLYPEGIQVNPKMPGSMYPERNLAGVAVSLKVAQNLAANILGTSPEEFYELNKDFMILGSLGSIADRVPPIGENRNLILLGLNEFKRSTTPWVKALREESLCNYNLIINRIIPILASARGDEGVSFYLCKDSMQIKKYISKFQDQQRSWQTGYSRHLPTVLKSAKIYPNFILAIAPNLPLEFLGSFANRLKEEFQRTAMVVAKHNSDWAAELRGKGKIDLIKELSVLQTDFLDFGGHPLACGLSFCDQVLDQITEKIIKISESFKQTEDEMLEIKLPIAQIEKSLKKIFPISRKTRFISEKSEIEDGIVDNRKVIWNTAPPADGQYDVIYTLDENLNIYIKKARCQP